MTKDEALNLALEALEGNCTNPLADPEQAQKEDQAITAIREALAQSEQEPVVTRFPMKLTCTKCGAVDDGFLDVESEAPPQRKPLTDEEIKRMAAKWFLSMYWPLCNTFAREIEATHGIKE